jgi:hypothetical protein
VHSVCALQILCEISVKTYLAAGNPFDVVSPPEVCARCQTRERFHRHGTYQRYIQEKQCRIARFICAVCWLTVSVLPAFVFPYRPRLVTEVDRYFVATTVVRREQSGADTLRRYWRQWCAHWPSLQQKSGWPTVRPLKREAAGYWRQVRAVAGGLAHAQAQLASRFGLALLRHYTCHRVPTGA